MIRLLTMVYVSNRKEIFELLNCLIKNFETAQSKTEERFGNIFINQWNLKEKLKFISNFSNLHMGKKTKMFHFRRTFFFWILFSQFRILSLFFSHQFLKSISTSCDIY